MQQFDLRICSSRRFEFTILIVKSIFNADARARVNGRLFDNLAFRTNKFLERAPSVFGTRQRWQTRQRRCLARVGDHDDAAPPKTPLKNYRKPIFAFVDRLSHVV